MSCHVCVAAIAVFDAWCYATTQPRAMQSRIVASPASLRAIELQSLRLLPASPTLSSLHRTSPHLSFVVRQVIGEHAFSTCRLAGRGAEGQRGQEHVQRGSMNHEQWLASFMLAHDWPTSFMLAASLS